MENHVKRERTSLNREYVLSFTNVTEFVKVNSKLFFQEKKAKERNSLLSEMYKEVKESV